MNGQFITFGQNDNNFGQLDTESDADELLQSNNRNQQHSEFSLEQIEEQSVQKNELNRIRRIIILNSSSDENPEKARIQKQYMNAYQYKINAKPNRIDRQKQQGEYAKLNLQEIDGYIMMKEQIKQSKAMNQLAQQTFNTKVYSDMMQTEPGESVHQFSQTNHSRLQTEMTQPQGGSSQRFDINDLPDEQVQNLLPDYEMNSRISNYFMSQEQKVVEWHSNIFDAQYMNEIDKMAVQNRIFQKAEPSDDKVSEKKASLKSVDLNPIFDFNFGQPQQKQLENGFKHNNFTLPGEKTPAGGDVSDFSQRELELKNKNQPQMDQSYYQKLSLEITKYRPRNLNITSNDIALNSTFNNFTTSNTRGKEGKFPGVSNQQAQPQPTAGQIIPEIFQNQQGTYIRFNTSQGNSRLNSRNNVLSFNNTNAQPAQQLYTQPDVNGGDSDYSNSNIRDVSAIITMPDEASMNENQFRLGTRFNRINVQKSPINTSITEDISPNQKLNTRQEQQRSNTHSVSKNNDYSDIVNIQSHKSSQLNFNSFRIPAKIEFFDEQEIENDNDIFHTFSHETSEKGQVKRQEKFEQKQSLDEYSSFGKNVSYINNYQNSEKFNSLYMKYGSQNN